LNEYNVPIEEYFPIDGDALSLPAEEEIIEAGLDNPVGTPDLAEMVSPGQRVLIIVDDNTRTTPAERILPYLLTRLNTAGISDANIKFLVGLGTHRAMSAKELEQKLGKEVYQRYSVYNHDWEKSDDLLNIGKTTSGIDIWINRHLTEADFIIGLGHIVPHRVAGYSGGGKIIQPGLCGPATTAQTHWLSAYYTAADIRIPETQKPPRRPGSAPIIQRLTSWAARITLCGGK